MSDQGAPVVVATPIPMASPPMAPTTPTAMPAPTGGSPVTRTELLRIVLDKWVPAFITAVVAGIVAAILVPYITTGYTRETSFQDRQLDIWEKLSLHLTAYINAREQLIQYVMNEPAPTASKEDVATYMATAAQLDAERKRATYELGNNLNIALYYYDDAVAKTVIEFRDWQGAREDDFGTVDPKDWARAADYDKWRVRLMTQIRESLQKE